MSASSLILRLQKGDKAALEEIYKEYRTSFTNWIVHSHKCTEDQAIDIFQYAIISFYEKVVEGEIEKMNDAGVKTYLFSIGKNKLLNDSRRQAKISYQEIDEDSLEAEMPELPVDSSRNIELKKILSELGEPCSEILRLFYFNQMTIEEIAEIMDYKNGNTVKNLKYKCLQRIKKALSKGNEKPRIN